MRVDAIKQAASGWSDGKQDQAKHAPAAAVESRALVSLAPPASPAPYNFRQAGFLAHLIATREHAPQTRERRRCEPNEALAAYRAVQALMSG